MNRIRPSSALQAAVLLCFLLIGAVGCALFSVKKFEPGGAYVSTDTSAAMPELYAMDSGFDLTYEAVDLVFKYEKDNRMALWAVSPRIKHEVDKLRVQASQVWLDYAVARQAYLSTPIPANLSALKVAVVKLQQINTALISVITTKGGS